MFSYVQTAPPSRSHSQRTQKRSQEGRSFTLGSPDSHTTFFAQFFYFQIIIFSFTGAHGTVYRARVRGTDRSMALKVMRFLHTEDGVPMSILREVSLLKQLQRYRHQNVVR